MGEVLVQVCTLSRNTPPLIMHRQHIAGATEALDATAASRVPRGRVDWTARLRLESESMIAFSSGTISARTAEGCTAGPTRGAAGSDGAAGAIMGVVVGSRGSVPTMGAAVMPLWL